MQAKDAVATKQNVTLWENWRSVINEFNSIEQVYVRFRPHSD